MNPEKRQPLLESGHFLGTALLTPAVNSFGASYPEEREDGLLTLVGLPRSDVLLRVRSSRNYVVFSRSDFPGESTAVGIGANWLLGLHLPRRVEPEMKKSKFTEELVAYPLRQTENGAPVADVCLQVCARPRSTCVSRS